MSFGLATVASAQSKEPIKIGFGMSLTGPLGAQRQVGAAGQKIWEEDINAKGGLLGRPVKLIYYDDQTNPSTVPGIYTKLLDVDKVDIVIGGYATNMLAPAMPIVMQTNKLFIGLLGLAVNTEFNYPNYFVDDPVRAGPEAVVHQGLLRHRAGAEPQAADGRHRRRRRRVLAQRRRRRARSTPRRRASRSSTTRPIRRRPPTSRRSCARSRRPIPTSSSICSYPLELGRHGAGGQRDRLQAEDDRRRHGRPAGDRRSRRSSGRCSTASSTTTSGCRSTKMKFPGVDDLIEEVPGQGGGRGRRSARLLHGAVGLCPDAGAASRRSRRPRGSTTTSSPTTSAPTPSRPWSATSSSAPRANGRSRASCRSSSTASRATTSSSSGPGDADGAHPDQVQDRQRHLSVRQGQVRVLKTATKSNSSRRAECPRGVFFSIGHQASRTRSLDCFVASLSQRRSHRRHREEPSAQRGRDRLHGRLRAPDRTCGSGRCCSARRPTCPRRRSCRAR